LPKRINAGEIEAVADLGEDDDGEKHAPEITATGEKDDAAEEYRSEHLELEPLRKKWRPRIDARR
jgi:hypothetical protein